MITGAVIVPFVDEDQIVVKVNGNDVLIEVGRTVVVQIKFSMIETIDKALEEAHHSFHVVQIVAVPSVVTWPIGRLRVLDHINSAVIKQRKQKLKRLDHMAVNVAAVINDNIQRAHASDCTSQEFLVRLAALQDHDPIFLQPGLVLDIDSKDRRVGEVIFPES